jgi:glycerol-3-phosphate cytidylyltransferase-like family protein
LKHAVGRVVCTVDYLHVSHIRALTEAANVRNWALDAMAESGG